MCSNMLAENDGCLELETAQNCELYRSCSAVRGGRCTNRQRLTVRVRVYLVQIAFAGVPIA